MIPTTRRFIPVLALACGLGACKEEDPTLDSGLPADKQGSELGVDEQTRLCEAREAFGAALISESEAKFQGCTLTGILFVLLMGGDQRDCEIIRDGCVNGDGEEMPAMCSLGVDWANCMATVAELEACYEENDRAAIEATKSLSCARIEEYKTQNPVEQETELGPACSEAQAKCATVLATDDAMP